MYCSKCKTSNEGNHKFCQNCGSDLTISQEKEEIQSPLQVVVQDPSQTPDWENSSTNNDVSEEPVKKKGGKVVKTILSIFCSILIFAITTAAMLIFTLRGSIAENRIKNVLDGIDIREALKDEEIENAIFIDLKTSDAVTIYEDGTMKEFMEEKLLECSEYILGGKKPDNIYAEDIVELMEENEEIIFEETGEKLNEKDYKKIEETGEELEESTYINRAVKKVRLICSVFVLAALALMLVLLSLLLLKVRNKSYDTLLWVGSTFSATAILFSLIGVATNFLSENFVVMGRLVNMVVQLYITEVVGVLLTNSCILLLIGLLMIVLYILIKGIKNRKRA